MTTTVTPEKPAEVAKTSTLDNIKALVKRSPDFNSVLKGLAQSYAPAAKPKVASLPVISEDDHSAIKKLVSVFGVVAPTSRRKLAPAERDALMTERETLDTVDKLVTKRKEAIRTIAYHHLDIEAEEDGLVDENTPRDKDGHYILEGFVDTGHAKGFKRSPRDGTAVLTVDAIRTLEGLGVITHDEFLEATKQTRIVHDDGILNLLKRRPELTQAFADAVSYTGRTSAMTLAAEK
jgi:hypothetical protein